jgi:KUP system potassium uptake protein
VAFFSSSLLKLPDGGWVTMLIAGAAVAVMATWRKGRRVLSRRLTESVVPLDDFLRDMQRKQPYRVPGTAVFMTLSPVGVPVTLLHYFKHNQVLHERVFLLSIRTGAVPFVKTADRLRVEDFGQGFHRLVAVYGFMETPDVPEIMRLAAESGLENVPEKTTYFLGRETLLTTGKSELSGWRKRLFSIMSRNAPPATTYFKIPPNRVMELGVLIEI